VLCWLPQVYAVLCVLLVYWPLLVACAGAIAMSCTAKSWQISREISDLYLE
jgi:hypothetical protein